MTSGATPNDDLIDQLRRRALGDEKDSFDWAKALSGNPLARGISQLFGIDLGPIRKAVRNSDQFFQTIAASMVFVERGWAPCGSMPMPVYEAAVAVLARGGTIDQAEEALVAGWNEQGILPYLHHRVLGLGLGKDDEIAGWYRERGRLVRRAWEHHVAGSYEAAIPIVLAQIDGITADSTLPPKGRGGKMFFSSSGSHHVEVVDDTTLAGMNVALPVARKHFMGDRHVTGAGGSLSRHGVMHGRELGYDTKANSTKTFVLLTAVVEWAKPRIEAEINHRRAERDKRYAGSDETDDQGRRLDRRGFYPTRDALRGLAFAQSAFWRACGRFGTLGELSSDVVAQTLLTDTDDFTVAKATEREWWAWRRSESGWVFAIGCAVSGDPLDLRYFDGPDTPSEGPASEGWAASDTGNWSGDWS